MPAFEVETGGHDEKSGERIQITRLTRRHARSCAAMISA